MMLINVSCINVREEKHINILFERDILKVNNNNNK
jgi:hypothetical protein